MEDNNIIKLMTQIENEYQGCASETGKFLNGNNSAGTRIRKHMQSIKNLAQEVRKEVQEQKNSVA